VSCRRRTQAHKSPRDYANLDLFEIVEVTTSPPTPVQYSAFCQYCSHAHPTAEWTLQQFREALPGDHPYRFLIHERDTIFSKDLDKQVVAMGVRVLRTPVRAPQANSVCERFGGTLRRECLAPLNVNLTSYRTTRQNLCFQCN